VTGECLVSVGMIEEDWDICWIFLNESTEKKICVNERSMLSARWCLIEDLVIL
jgi:hypothetical protein